MENIQLLHCAQTDPCLIYQDSKLVIIHLQHLGLRQVSQRWETFEAVFRQIELLQALRWVTEYFQKITRSSSSRDVENNVLTSVIPDSILSGVTARRQCG